MSLVSGNFKGMRSSEMLKKFIIDNARDKIERKQRKQLSNPDGE